MRGSIVEYNKFEKYMAKILDKYPNIRRISKYLYQRLSYMICNKENFSYELHPNACIKSILWKGKSNFKAFFG